VNSDSHVLQIRVFSVWRPLRSVVAVSIVFGLLSAGMASMGSTGHQSAEPVPDVSLSVGELQKAVDQSITRVDEFRFIKKEANRLGIKVYLFGGTAAAFAHYVKWDLQRQKGDTRFHPGRFDYKYVNIYRSTQDLDIVVDGDLDKLHELEKSIVNHFPYLQGSKGSKQAWEVRSLREDIGDKLALLNNPDILNQHTDSNSVGLIELTEYGHPSERIRDLREWDNLKDSGFLRDVIEGKIQYYFSPKHESTRFYREGRNPPILSVIRYFIKVFQFNLDTRPEDQPIVKEIVDRFNPQSVAGHSYLQKWFAENAPKLIQNAMDVEFAMQQLDEVGLRKKLQQIGSANELGSLSWWMHKQPLLSRPLGVGSAQTAAQLGIDIVAHETLSFLVYEAITRSHQLIPNVLESRSVHAGEAAVYGNGFYAKLGERSGVRGTGFTIRFRVDPQAMLGSDFTLHEDIIRITNRNAIRVIPDHLSMDLIGYYNWLLSVKEISQDDRGVFQRLRLAMRSNFLSPTEKEMSILRSMPYETLLKLFQKDPAVESKLLLIDIISEGFKTPSAIFEFLLGIKGWEATAAEDDRRLLHDKVWRVNQAKYVQIILSSNPSVNDLRRAFELGLLKGSEEYYLEIIVPKLQSLDEIEDFLSHWSNHYKGSRPPLGYPAPVRRHLLSVIKTLIQLQPTANTLEQVVQRFPNPMAVIAATLRWSEDPLVVSRSLTEGLRHPSTRYKVEKIWALNKQYLFGLKPSFSELLQMVPLLSQGEMIGDVIDYALRDLDLRRRSDVLALLSAIPQTALADSKDRGGRLETTLRGLMERFLSLKPSYAEIGMALNHNSLSPSLHQRLLAQTLTASTSFNEILALVKSNQNAKDIDQWLEQHEDWLRNLNYHREGVVAYARTTNYGKCAILMFIEYMQQNPSDHEFVLRFLQDSGNKLVRNFSTKIESIWINAFKFYLRLNIDLSEIIGVKGTVPTVDAYEHLFEAAVRRVESFREIIDFLSSENENLNLYFTQFERRKIADLHNRRLPEIVAERVAEFQGRSKLDLKYFYEMADSMDDGPSILSLLHLFLQNGAGHDWDASPGEIGWADSSIDGDSALTLRPSLSQKSYLEIDGLISLYHIVERETIMRPEYVNSYTPGRVVSSLAEKEKLRMLGLSGEKDLILAVSQYYHLKMLMNSWKTTDYASGEVFSLSWVENIFAWNHINFEKLEFAGDLQAQKEALSSKYKGFSGAAWAESGSLMGKAFNLISLSKNLAYYEKELQKDLKEANQTIRRIMAKHQDLVDKVTTALVKSPPNQCVEALK
jgi:hypothetical protein